VRTLWVVTHPEATHHVAGVVGGWHDSVLTREGRCDAAAIGRELRTRIPQGAAVELYSSDLARAAQTATAIGAALEVEPILMEGLREKSYGEAEARPQAWLGERFIPPPAGGDRMNHFEGIPGSETRAEFASRIYAAMEAILGLPCERQIIVTHGFALTFVVACWIGMPLSSAGYVNFRASSGSISELHEDDYYHNRQVVQLNDVRHLADAGPH